jgi:hypothetical protein
MIPRSAGTVASISGNYVSKSEEQKMSDMNTLSEKVRVVRWRMSNEKLRFSDEMRIIPAWVVLPGLFISALMWIFIPALNFHDPHPMPFPLLLFLLCLGSFLIVALSLLIGYVNRDAKRRGMSPTLWTLLVMFIPNAIGFIIYFIVREPLVFNCSQCGGTVSARFNFCPKCKYNLHPTCPECKHEVRPDDRFCPFCAHEMAAGGPVSARPVTPIAPGANA